MLMTVNNNGSDMAKAVLSFGKDQWIVFDQDRSHINPNETPMATVVCSNNTGLRFHLYNVNSNDATDALCHILDQLGIDVRIEEGGWDNAYGFNVYASRPISVMDTRKIREMKCN